MAQLVDVADGYHLWSERYDRHLDDVFAIQEEIAESIVAALQVVLSEDERRAIVKPPAENVEAYQFYLRGRQYFHQFSRTSIEYSRRMFERAIEIDPSFALAHAGAAACSGFLYTWWHGDEANLEGADSASRKAIELDPELAEARAARGFALSLRKLYDGARREFETAIRLNPNLYEAHYFFARACHQEGRLEESVRHFEDAARVRPDDFQAHLLMSGSLAKMGRPELSRAALRAGLSAAEKHLELNPDDARALYLGGVALMQLGKREQALEWAQRAYAIAPADTILLYNLACLHALGGMVEEALNYLEQAVENGYAHHEWIDNDSDLDSLRNHPRFQTLRQRM